MALATPEASLGTALGVAALSYGVFQHNLPPMADIRTCESNNRDVHATAKSAAWVSAAAVAGVSLITKDATIFTLGGAFVLVLYWTAQHANHVSPLTGKVATNTMTVQDIVGAQGGSPQTWASNANYASSGFDPII
jgi:hypothetical protein